MPVYSQKVMDHFMSPRNVGEIENADGIGEVGNPICGDMMTFYIKVDNNHLSDVKFKTFGCGAAIAVSSMVSEMATGKTLDEAMEIIFQCADGLLAAHALEGAFLEHAEELHLQRHLHFANLIQQESPAVGEAKLPGLIALGVCKCAFLVTE